MAPPIKSSKVGYKELDELESPSNSLWVGNLAADVSDSDLMGVFAKYGALDSVTTYTSRSYAFLYFKRVEDAAAAKEALQGTILRGSPLKIEFARPVCCSHLCVSLGRFWSLLFGIIIFIRSVNCLICVIMIDFFQHFRFFVCLLERESSFPRSPKIIILFALQLLLLLFGFRSK